MSQRQPESAVYLAIPFIDTDESSRNRALKGLSDKLPKALHHKNRADNPHPGQCQVSRQIKKVYKIDISATGVRNIWLREQMQTTALRLQKSNSIATVR